jgi:hypothetical protein
MQVVEPGEFIDARVDITEVYDLLWTSIEVFKDTGAKRVFDREKVVTGVE